MEGFKYPGFQIIATQLENGLLFGVLSEDTPIKLNCSEVTARFARNAFERPKCFNEADINIVGSELSMKEIAKIISEVKNMNVVYRKESYEKSLEYG